MEKIHNIYINSTNKTGGNTKNYDYKLYFTNYNISINHDEECYIYLKSFQTLNTFYNINDSSKSITVVRENNFTQQANFYEYILPTGNYNCYEFAEVVNSLCSDHFTMSYNNKKNCYTFIQNPLLTNSTVALELNKNHAKYFGLSPDTRSYINGTEANPIYGMIINLNYFSLIVIKIIGLITNNKTIDNFTSNEVQASDIFGLVNRQDAAINSLIYFTDINNSFMYKIQNNDLNYLNFVFTNEFNELLTDIQDWLMVLQIVIKQKNKLLS